MNDPVDKAIHGLRNPLNTIAMNAELGKLSLQKNADITRAVEILDVILSECQKCSEQLHHLREELLARD